MPRGIPDGQILKRTKKRLGKTVTTYWARVRYVDSEGHPRTLERRADSYTDAVRLRRELKTEAERLAVSRLAPSKPTFAMLAAYYREEYLKPPVYNGQGKKIEGLRSHAKVAQWLTVVEQFFKAKPLQEIDFAAVRAFQKERSATPTKQGRQRAVASVNRELELLRRLFRIALHLKWLTEHPMAGPQPLIVKAHENERMRVLTHDEELRLLAACETERKRAHLYSAVVCALDTALRFNEQVTLTWAEVNWTSRRITVRARNAKTNKTRFVPLTARLATALRAWRQQCGAPPDGARIWPFGSFKRSFATVCEAAGIADFRWHDLRHTATVWLLEAGLDTAEAMKITGHDQMKTFLRYLSFTDERTAAFAAQLDAHRAALDAPHAALDAPPRPDVPLAATDWLQ